MKKTKDTKPQHGRPECGKESPTNVVRLWPYYCTRYAGHPGQHVASTPGGHACVRWSA